MSNETSTKFWSDGCTDVVVELHLSLDGAARLEFEVLDAESLTQLGYFYNRDEMYAFCSDNNHIITEWT